ncbi:mask [Symbiodinium necroappetens]|uniref:Mask protein n=1 Tax=Symbiodinium necroappetens TaxID=1628268 RepID=A0A812YG47_9DINO|nr:mask [Symbiodinium necroappetens]
MLRVFSSFSGELVMAIRSEQASNIASVKRHLQRVHGISCYRQKLLHDGRVLADSEEITSPVDLLVVLLRFGEASAQEMQRFQNAAIHGDVRVMKEMLQSCHDPNCSQGLTPLAVAACCGHLDVVELVLEAGADTNKGDERTGLTALALACQNGRLEVARFLLESGADKDQSTRTGFTPLFTASCHGHIEVVRMLLSAGVNLDIVVESENVWECGTPILTACQKGHVEIARLLVEAGADVEKRSRSRGKTPFFQAAILSFEMPPLSERMNFAYYMYAVATGSSFRCRRHVQIVHLLLDNERRLLSRLWKKFVYYVLIRVGLILLVLLLVIPVRLIRRLRNI